MNAKQDSVTAVHANESDCKAILQFVNKANTDMSHYMVLDPFSIVQNGKVKGRLIRQMLFDGRYNVYQLNNNTGEYCGILITAEGKALKGRSMSLIFYLLDQELCIEGVQQRTHGDGSRVIIISGESDALNIEKFGFYKLESIPLANGHLDYYFLDL